MMMGLADLKEKRGLMDATGLDMSWKPVNRDRNSLS